MNLDRYLRDARGRSIEPVWQRRLFKAVLGLLLVPLRFEARRDRPPDSDAARWASSILWPE